MKNQPVEWKISGGLTDYPEAVSFMEARAADIAAGTAPEMVWLVEHPPLYTGGTSAKSGDLLDGQRFPVYASGRGGQFTYHGPGQRVAYVMLDLKKRAAPGQPDIRAYVQQLEQWLIATLGQFGVTGYIREGRVGVWVDASSLPLSKGSEFNNEAKIAALGIRVRKWVTYHGVALNVAPDLTHYAGIVPCGLGNFGVTSLKALGIDTSMHEVDAVLRHEFTRLFA